MKRKLVEEYFTFSKKERNAVIVLLVLIVAVFILPYCLPRNESIEKEILAAVSDTAIDEEEANQEQEAPANTYQKKYTTRLNTAIGEEEIQPFNFDPNTLNTEGWRRLGLKERTIQTINNYLSKGGKFRKPDDLRKIFGITARQAERLMPYVTIAGDMPFEKKSFPEYVEKRPASYSMIDINEADSLTLIQLRGIGPKLAVRIIKFRDKLGGFHSKEQLNEVFGLPDSTIEQVLPRLKFTGSNIKKVDINNADVSSLANHPYIGRPLAKVIVSYREQHGKFQKLEDLLGIDVINQQLVNRLSPYLSF